MVIGERGNTVLGVVKQTVLVVHRGSFARELRRLRQLAPWPMVFVGVILDNELIERRCVRGIVDKRTRRAQRCSRCEKQHGHKTGVLHLAKPLF